MLNDACNHLFDAPHMVVFPALAVLLSVLAFNLLVDAWRHWLDPRTRSQMTALENSRSLRQGLYSSQVAADGPPLSLV
jgi:hypothetical protein